MEDKYSKMDAKKYLSDVVDEITRREKESFDSDDRGILEGLDDDEFSLSEELGLTELEEYIKECLWIIDNNYIQLRALFLKLYKLRNNPELSSMDKTEIDRLVELIYDGSNSRVTIKADLDAENMAARKGK